METIKTSQVILKDLRQSEEWGKYLEWIGWKSFKTSSGVAVQVMKTPIGGLIKVQHPKSLSHDDLDEIEKISLENKGLFIKVEPYIGQDTTLLEDKGYIPSTYPLSPPSTVFIHLYLPETELWDNISKSGRYSIRRAGKEGIHVEFHRSPSDDILRTFYDVSRETSKKQGFTIQSYEDLTNKRDVFAENSYMALGYDKDGNILGGKFFLSHGEGVWYLHAGTNQTGRSSDAGHKMMWESFLYFKNLGFKILDMDGIDDDRFPQFTKKWGGFSFFKEKFGGETIRFPHPYIKYLNSFLKFLGRSRQLPL